MPLLPKKANTPDNNQTLDDRTPVPAGDYVAAIVKTEFKQTKQKNGHYLSIQFKILEGEYKGRSLFTNLNLDNPNPVAVEIANKELNSICQACNLQGVEDSDQLLNIPILVSVKVTEPTPQYPAQNETTGYAPAEGAGAVQGAPTNSVPDDVIGNQTVAPTQAPAQTAAPQAATPSQAPAKLPWE